MNTVEMQIQLVTKTPIPKNMFILYQGCAQKKFLHTEMTCHRDDEMCHCNH